jgi:hypothetical protein
MPKLLVSVGISEASITHQCFDFPRFRQFKHWWRLWQIDVHVPD